MEGDEPVCHNTEKFKENETSKRLLDLGYIEN